MTCTSPSHDSRPDRVEPDQATIDSIFQQWSIQSIDKFEYQIAVNLEERGWTEYESSEAFREALVHAVEDAFLESSGKIAIPDVLDAAIEDASYWLINSDLPTGAPFESAVCPRFTRSIALIIPAYADRSLDTVGGLQRL